MKKMTCKTALVLVLMALASGAWAQGQTITFSVTADIPYGSSEVPTLQQQIADHNKYSPSDLLVHLGDIKSGTSSCPEANYRDFADYMKELKVPVFLVPGDNEYNDCSNPTQGWSYWMLHLGSFEQYFCGVNWTVERQSVRPENFAFVNQGVLFIGINLVGGSVHSQSEWNTRMQQDADWVDFQYDTKGSQVRAAVVFGHAGPSGSRDLFFDQFDEDSGVFGKPVLYMHGDGHSWSNNKPFTSQNIRRVQVDDGGTEAPVQVTVDMDPVEPFSFLRDPWDNNPQIVNKAPCVEAGPDQSVTLPNSVQLTGRSSDDGDPNPPGNSTLSWSKVSGPGTVTFGSPNNDTTSASFGSGGTFILRLTGNDSQLQSTDDVTVTATVLGPSFFVDDVTLTEGDAGTSIATFTVTLVNGTGESVWVDYATADGSATQGSDYLSIAGTLNFSGSTISHTVNVVVNGDVVDENEETFFVNLSNPSGAGLGDGQGMGTIADNDNAPPPSISSFSPASGAIGIQVTITGVNFLAVTGVQFNGTPATTYTVNSSTQITATVPTGASTGKVRVTNTGGTALSATDFAVTAAGIFTFFPTDDAYVRSSSPTSNFATSSSLRVRASSSEILNSYLKFDVSGLIGPVQSAKLRLKVTDAGSDGGGAYPVANEYLGTMTPWVQSGLIWDNAPAISGTPLSSVGSVTNGSWVEFDVTAAVLGHGVTNLAIKNNGTDVVFYSSKETSDDPELVITADFGNPPPTISSFSPASALVGAQVTLTGSNFTGVTVVKFNGTPATFTMDSPGQIRANVPIGATNGKIAVTTASGTSTSAAYLTVIPPNPTVSSFSPAGAGVGMEVTINGTNFSTVSSVKFNGVEAASFIVDSVTQIRAIVPSGATTGKISVTTSASTGFSVNDFILIATPAIASFTPNSGSAGAVVTITGANLTGATSAKFNNTAASSFTVDSDTQIQATVALGSTTGKITVTTGGGTATSADDFIVPPPTIASFTPNNGPVSTEVTITGGHFMNATSVKFNTTLASTFTVDSATQIRANVPAGATTGKITVTTPAGAGVSAADFTVILPPSIASFTPTSGLVNVEVTITGNNFTGVSSVKFNGTAASVFTMVSNTEIRANVPSGATHGKISVTNSAASATSTADFTVIPPPPTIASFTPASGLPGAAVTITGTNFTDVNNVKFNSVTASPFTVVSNTQISVNVPAGASTGKISVTTLGGTATSTDDFIVPPPAIASFTPASGMVGVEVTITGGNFVGVSSVKFNTTAVSTFTVDSATQIRVNVPSNATTGKISVTTAAGTGTSAGDFIFFPPPSITSFTPNGGLVNTEVTITGANLINATTVKFNAATATVMTVDSDTQIRANVPDNATTGKITVITPGGAVLSANNFTVIPPAPTLVSFTPLNGYAGMQVTITGSNFTGPITVMFNATTASTIFVDSATQIRANVPSGATTGKISVTTDGGTAVSVDDFTVTVQPPPTIASFSPLSGLVGAEVTILGSDFIGASSVRFNGTAASTFTIDSNTQIRASVPSGATNGKISVTTGGGTGTSVDDFTVESSSSSTVTLNPTDDSYVNSDIPTTNYGTNSTLRVRKTTSATLIAYLKFDVSGLTGNVQSAMLRLRVSDASNDGGSVYLVSNNYEGTSDPWTQTGIIWTNAPAVSGIALSAVGAVANGAWVEFNVTPAIGGNGIFSFAIKNNSSDVVYYRPKEQTDKPQLVIQTGSGTPAPIVSSFAPVSGATGTLVTLSGSYFSGATSVKFNGVAGSFTVVASTQIQANVPAGATTGIISVTTGAGTGQSLSNFTVTAPAPAIASFSPTTGAVGATVTILGTDFTGATNVKFNNVTASYTVNSATQITATVPTSATTGKISVTTSGGTATSADDFVVQLPPAPEIASFTPNNGPVGTQVTIDGSHFTGATSVKFNNVAASTFAVNSDAQIQATVPSGAATGKISVTTAGGTATSVDDFTVLVPFITSFTPTSGPVGAEVTISGGNFNGATTVKFNATTATTFFVDSPTQIRANVPAGATTGKISVTTGGGTATSADDFTVLVPFITSFTPTSGLVGAQVTIAGGNFNGATTVKFNATTATTFFVDSPTQIRANVPAGATTGKISVTTGGGTATSVDDFTVLVPFITSFTPTSGPVDTEVTITGGNFTGATSVKFNNLNASSFIVDNEAQIRANVPTGATTGKISVTTSAGTTLSADDFTVTFDAGATVTFNPTDDSYVRASTPTTSYATSATLRQRLSGTSEILYTYLKFNVAGLSTAVQSAKLQLKVVDASNDGGAVYLVSNNYEGTTTPWDQAGLLWTNAPAITGTPLASAGAVTNGAIVEFDVTAAVTGNGIYSFAMKNASSDAVHYNSREGTTKPALVVQTSVASQARKEGASEQPFANGTATASLPKQLALHRAYPNPFNGSTTIQYDLPEAANARLLVYNALGQLIRTLVDENQAAGYKRVVWDARDDHGVAVSSGVYLYRLDVGSQHLTGKVILQQ